MVSCKLYTLDNNYSLKNYKEVHKSLLTWYKHKTTLELRTVRKECDYCFLERHEILVPGWKVCVVVSKRNTDCLDVGRYTSAKLKPSGIITLQLLKKQVQSVKHYSLNISNLLSSNWPRKYLEKTWVQTFVGGKMFINMKF